MLFKEMVPVTVTIALLAPVLREVVFGVAVDNTGVAFAVNKLTCRDRSTSGLLQQTASDLDRHGHTVLGAHVRRARNTHADDLSHALPREMWRRLSLLQRAGVRAFVKRNYWLFPFVAHCTVTGACYSGCFKMRRSLFANFE